MYFGRFVNVAFHAVASPFSSTVPSSSIVLSVAVPSATSVNVTFAPSGAVVVPSAFFHAFSASICVFSCVFVIVSPEATAPVGLTV